MTELYTKYRPKTFKDVIGQEQAVETLNRFLKTEKLPHQLMFTGPSGTGKTSIARILKKKLDCYERDFLEVNAALERGIDMIREISKRYRAYGMGPNKTRIYLIDEAAKLTSDAQSSLLKMTEDCPKHVYFMLATTDPGKLVATLRSRFTEIKCQSIPDSDLAELIRDILKKEERTVNHVVGERIVEQAKGSARRVLVMLNAVLQFEDKMDQLRAVDQADPEYQWNQIGVALIYRTPTWGEICDLIKGLGENDDWEGIRRRLLAMAANVLIDKAKIKFHGRASLLIVQFGDNYYDTGRAGFIGDAFRFVVKK